MARHATAQLDLSRDLGRKILPLTVGIALLISVGFLGIFVTLQYMALGRAAAIYAENLSDQLRAVVLADPALWKYQTYKFAQILDQFAPADDVTIVRVLDEEGRPVAERARGSQEASIGRRFGPVRSAPLRFNNRRVGTILVGLSLTPLLSQAATFFLAFAAAGGGLAALAYLYPLRVVTGMEVRIKSLIDALRLSNAESERLRTAAEASEQQVRALNTQLEKRVASRTAQLAEAKEEADRASRAKSEFLSRMSHELRTPLNAILGFAQLLEMDALSATQGENVRHILKGGQHLLGLINEVLDIARIEAGRLAISPEPVSVGEVTREALTMTMPLAAERHVHLHMDAGEGWGQHALADRQRLHQVLLNLLSNAIKYNREEGHVALSCEVTAEGRLRIKIRDQGPGIPAEMINRLFIPFERLEETKGHTEGTGIGLALSKKLMELMSGTIGVESVAGQGSTFWVELARTESPAGWGRATDTSEAAHAGAAEGANAVTVLYIEDNLSNLELVQRVLAHRPGVQLLPVMQGRLGLEMARELHPDLILLDVHLPDMPGDEVLQRLWAAPETRGIPVVMISADPTRAQVERLLALGARAYLAKPLEVRQLLAVLDRILYEKTAASSPFRAPAPA